MQGLYSESYMPLGDLVIRQSFAGAPVVNYYRDLNIVDAVATTKYTVNGVNYKREVFVSAPDNIIMIRISADKRKQLSIDLSVSSQLKYHLEAGNAVLALKGKAPAHVEPSYYNPKRELVVYNDTAGCRGMRFELLAKAVNIDGKITTDTAGIHIAGATEIILYLTAATSFNGYDKCPDKEGKDEHKLQPQHWITQCGKIIKHYCIPTYRITINISTGYRLI